MAIDGYMAFQKYPGGDDDLLKSESLVVWKESDNELGGKNSFINFKSAAEKGRLFEIEDWNFGVERILATASQSSGIGTGSATFNAFNITRKIDRASPILFEMACNGTAFRRVSLALRKATGGQESGQVYLRYDFKLVGVKSINWAHGEDAATETVEFEYGALQVRYRPQDSNGSLGAVIPGGWNRITNTQDILPDDIKKK